MELSFGKKIVSESFSNGKQTKRVITYSIPILVADRVQVMSEMMKALDLITSKQTDELTLTIRNDKNHNLKFLIKSYEIVENNTLHK